MRWRIFVTYPGLATRARTALDDAGCIVHEDRQPRSPEELAAALGRFRPDALIVRAGKITSAAMLAAGALKVVCKHGVGTDNIDLEGATALGVPVLFTPFANCESVAEHTFALILALLRRIPLQDRRIRSGVFDKSAYDGVELRGKTLGLVGFGRSARRLAELVAPFDVRVVAHHPSHTEESLPVHVRKVPGIREVFAAADILSLHCPLTDQTRGLISDATIAAMKRGVYIVNTARGGLVNERDLAAALHDGRVAAAALDVFETEPPEGSPLLRLDSVVLTPHVAGASDVASERMGTDAVGVVLAVLSGAPVDPRCVVNPGRDAP